MPEFLDKIRSAFKGIDIDYTTATLGGDYPVFIVRLNDERTLADNWKAVTSVIAVRFHGGLREDQDFERWNTYIIFACVGPVDKGLRGMIENNKFAARKIVAPAVSKEMLDASLVDKYVTNKDILMSDISEKNDMQATGSVSAQLPEEKLEDYFRTALSNRTNGLRELVGNDFVVSRLGGNQQSKLERLLKKIEESL